MIGLVLAAATVSAPLSPAGQAVVAAIQASIADVRARQAALPPARTDAERLVRLGELDQAPRKIITSFDFSTVPAAERPQAVERASALIEAVDRENQKALLKLVPHNGWFLRSTYGQQAALAAFLIVQHGDVALQARFLPVIAPLVKQGEVDGQNYGMMFDRVAVSQGRPQTYGTQFRCDGGKWRPYPIVDPEHLDQRRADLAFPGTFAQTKAYFERSPSCPQTRLPPPPGMKFD